MKKRHGLFRTCTVRFRNEEVVLAQPATYMNESGRAVRALLEQGHEIPEHILVMVDDVALPLGKIRFRPRGSSGGHNGLKSIIEEIQSQEFPRLRIGIRPLEHELKSFPGDLAHFVLGKFRPEEEPLLQPAIEKAVQASLDW